MTIAPFVDPYDGMTDDEFTTMVDDLVAKQRTVPIGLRLGPALLIDNIIAIATELHIPYQRLAKEWLSVRDSVPQASGIASDLNL